MRVAQINAVYGILSTGRTTMELSKYLQAHGHISKIFYGAHPDEYEDDVVYMGSEISHKIHAITSRIVGDSGCGSYFATQKLISALREFHPDIVHLRNLHSNYVNISMLLKFLAEEDIPTVQHLHDCFNFTGGCTYYTLNKCNEWNGNECRNCKYQRRGVNYLFCNRAHHNYREKVRLYNSIPRLAVVGVSKWVAEEAKKSEVFSNAKIVTHIYNSINFEAFKPQDDATNLATKHKLGLDNKHILLGVAANWIPAKGLNDLVALSHILPDDFHIVLVGGMPTNVNLPQNMTSVARTDNVQELVNLYSAADVFVHLSMEETFGKVTAEALSCGTPAVVYDSTASPELVDESTGRVVKPQDIAGVKQAICELLASDKEIISQACLARVRELFNLSKNFEMHINLYKNIIKDF